MEEIAEGFLKLIVGAIRWVAIDVLLHIFCFNLGRVTLLILTVGRYPRLQVLERDETKITTFGVAIIILAWVAVYVYNVYLELCPAATKRYVH
jgi:hypothetical protein